MKNKKITVHFCRKNESGNIFEITARAVRELNNAGKQAQARELKIKVWESPDYEDALKVVGEYVELVEDE